MIKRIIFDLDNTLIDWNDDYLIAYKYALDEFNINEDYEYIGKLFDLYESTHDKQDKEAIINYMNERLDNKINMEVLERMLYHFSFMGDVKEDVKKTLEYLSSKYELVVLTSWIQKPQEERLKNAGILNYFINVIGGDEIMKPDKRAFIKAIGNHDCSECIMIGDNYEKDVIGAYNAGIKPIYYNRDNKENKNNFEEIKDIKELMNIL